MAQEDGRIGAVIWGAVAHHEIAPGNIAVDVLLLLHFFDRIDAVFCLELFQHVPHLVGDAHVVQLHSELRGNRCADRANVRHELPVGRSPAVERLGQDAESIRLDLRVCVVHVVHVSVLHLAAARHWLAGWCARRGFDRPWSRSDKDGPDILPGIAHACSIVESAAYFVYWR